MAKKVNHLKPGEYKTDLYNLNPIFLVKDNSSVFKSKNCFVRSWEEALSLIGKPKLEDINFEYVASFIANNPRCQISPYKSIKRLPRSNNVVISDDGSYTCKYSNPFSYDISPSNEIDLNNKIRRKFFEQIKLSLKGFKGCIGSELSGGIDSNLIVSSLLKILDKKDIKRLHTFSYKIRNEEKSIRMCRDFYDLPRGNSHLIDVSVSDGNLIYEILGYLPQTAYLISNCESFSRNNCSLIFSGIGGDQCLSNYGNNIPTDLINEKRFKELFEWCGSKGKFVRVLLKRYLYKLFPKFLFFKYSINPKRSLTTKILCSNLTKNVEIFVKPLLKDRYYWEIDVHSDTRKSIIKRLMSNHLALRVEHEYLIAKYFGVEKSFPLLNENLINFILKQDVLIFAKNSSKKRNLVKNVFKDILPTHLSDNPKKDFFSTSNFDKDFIGISRQIENFLKSSSTYHSFIREIWDLDSLKKLIMDCYKKNLKNYTNLLQIYRAILKINQLNDWFLFIDKNKSL